VSLEVLYRSVQRGGSQAETRGSSDSPIMVAQACFTQEGAALPSKALALPFSRRPQAGARLESQFRERGSWRGGEARARRVVHRPCVWPVGNRAYPRSGVGSSILGLGQLMTQVLGGRALPSAGPPPTAFYPWLSSDASNIFTPR